MTRVAFLPDTYVIEDRTEPRQRRATPPTHRCSNCGASIGQAVVDRRGDQCPLCGGVVMEVER